jgi:hypothetical protein
LAKILNIELYLRFFKIEDVSSISGSDTESDDSNSSSQSDTDISNAPLYAQVARNKPRISFKLSDNTILVMLRCILHGKKVNNAQNNQDSIINNLLIFCILQSRICQRAIKIC